MFDFLLALALSSAMVFVTCLMFYEIIRITWDIIPRMHLRPRIRVVAIIIAIFVGHTAAVWLYGALYWLLVSSFHLGTLTGNFDGSFESALYFSCTTYSSLGYGDILPTEHLRLLAGIQVINGLVLIGWSISFTYLAMEKFWDMHKKGDNFSPRALFPGFFANPEKGQKK